MHNLIEQVVNCALTQNLFRLRIRSDLESLVKIMP